MAYPKCWLARLEGSQPDAANNVRILVQLSSTDNYHHAVTDWLQTPAKEVGRNIAVHLSLAEAYALRAELDKELVGYVPDPPDPLFTVNPEPFGHAPTGN